MVSVSRKIAVEVLRRVDKDDAWATPTLDAAISKASIEDRDARLATTIVYGTLRVLPALDSWIATATKGKGRIEPFVRATLRCSAFQLRHLARVPVHAIVNDAVNLVRNKRGQRLGGFVNAVLRKLSKERPETPQLPNALAVPDWLLSKLNTSLGELRTDALVSLPAESPPIHLRLRNPDQRDELIGKIRDVRPEAVCEPNAFWAGSLAVRRVGDPRELPGYAEGSFTVQDEASQMVLQMLDAQPGESIADVCAGRGGKTVPIAQRVGPSGRVLALDLHEHRLDQIPAELERVGIEFDVERRTVDLSVGPAGLSAEFDRVLVDAPCTGLGTIRRRPEIMNRLKPEDIERMAMLQRAILNNAARLVRPGGTLIYAVCSPIAEEGEAHEISELPDFRLLDSSQICENTQLNTDSSTLKWGPWNPSSNPFTDAFQVLRWVDVRQV